MSIPKDDVAWGCPASARQFGLRWRVVREFGSTLFLILRLFDFALVAGTWIAVGAAAQYPYDAPAVGVITVGCLAAAVSFHLVGLYRPWRALGALAEVVVLLRGVGVWMVSILALLRISGVDISNVLLLYWFAGTGTVLVAAHLALRKLLAAARQHGWNRKQVALVTYSQTAKSAVEILRNATWLGYDVVGYFDDRKSPRQEGMPELRRLGATSDMDERCRDLNLHELWICLPLRAERRLQEIYHALRHCTANIAMFVDMRSMDLVRHEITELGGLPMVYLTSSPMMDPGQIGKEILDRTLAALALLLFAPLLVLIAVGVKLSSPGPILFRQVRVGWNSRPFVMHKFRTMTHVPGADLQGEFTAPADTRCTRFGALLRRSSLDEFPQFFNVLKGEMSIVGPRPERPHLVERFKEEIPMYMKKHMVKSGITGWAQVHGLRGQTDLQRRIEYDLFYINNWSLGLDWRIMAMTLRQGLFHQNAY